ncbi:MAG: carboxypeptidase-like regulatory domain-containing protein [Planctomycetota bacterium]
MVNAKGEPLAGARVFLLPAPDDQRAVLADADPAQWLLMGIEAVTGPDGRFPLHVARADVKHAVVARMPGYGWEFATLDPAAEELPQIKLTLEPTAHLRGQVVTKDGDPVRGARVRHGWSYIWDSWLTWETAKALYAELIREEVETDADGRFEFREVRHESQEVLAEAEGFAPARMGEVSPDAEVKLMLVPAAVVFGSVTDRLGQPIPGARVKSITYGCLPEQSTPWVMCKEDGTYVIESALSGSISVSAWTDRDFCSDRVNLTAEPGTRTRLDIVLKREAEIEGQVVDSCDAGVPSVPLLLLSERSGTVAFDVETNPEGRFVARNLHPGDFYRIGIEGTKTYGPLIVSGVPAGRRDVKIRLLEVGTIWGQLQYDGEPASEVRVRFLPRKDLPDTVSVMWRVPSIQKNEKKRYLEIDGETYTHRFWPGVYDIEFFAAGYAPIVLRNITVPPGKSPRPLDLHFALAAPVSGVVLDAATKEPVGGAQIEVLEEYYTGGLQRSPHPFAAASDATGQFTLQARPEGPITLVVLAAGYAPKTIRGVAVLTAGGEPLTAELSHGGHIEGRVDTSYVDPSSTIEVTVRELGREDGDKRFVNIQGEFSFDHVPPGRVEVVLTDWYYTAMYPPVRPQIRQVVVGDGETVRVNFDTATGVTLQGRVQGWDKPLLIEARLMESEGKPVVAGACNTDREGCFRIPHLRPGHYWVGSTAGEPGYAIAVSDELTITSAPPEELILVVPENTVQGTIRDSQGEPIPRAVVTVEREGSDRQIVSMCLAGAEGEFAIGGLEEGAYAFRARARGFATELLEVQQLFREKLDIRLKPEAQLRVSVCDDVGTPLPGAIVGVRHTVLPKLAQRELCGLEGSVTFPALKAYPHEVAASLDGYIPCDPLIVPLREGETSAVRLVLVRAGEIEVSITGEKGIALKDVPVFLCDEKGDNQADRTTDEKGRALFKDLKRGWYEVKAGPGAEVSDAVEVLPGERSQVDLVLPGSK